MEALCSKVNGTELRASQRKTVALNRARARHVRGKEAGKYVTRKGRGFFA
jgi:hypothetical protein